MFRTLGMTMAILNMVAGRALYDAHIPESQLHQLALLLTVVGIGLMIFGPQGRNCLPRQFWPEGLVMAILSAVLMFVCDSFHIPVRAIAVSAFGYSAAALSIVLAVGLVHWFRKS